MGSRRGSPRKLLCCELIENDKPVGERFADFVFLEGFAMNMQDRD